MYFAGSVEADLDDGSAKTKDDKQADLLVSDLIMNYKTVASFGNDDLLIKDYVALQQYKIQADIKQGKIFGLSWGISQAVTNLVFGGLYLASGEMYAVWPDEPTLQGDKLFIAMFCLLFGAFTAGQAMQFGPDITKAKAAAMKIY